MKVNHDELTFQELKTRSLALIWLNDKREKMKIGKMSTVEFIECLDDCLKSFDFELGVPKQSEDLKGLLDLLSMVRDMEGVSTQVVVMDSNGNMTDLGEAATTGAIVRFSVVTGKEDTLEQVVFHKREAAERAYAAAKEMDPGASLVEETLAQFNARQELWQSCGFLQ